MMQAPVRPAQAPEVKLDSDFSQIQGFPALQAPALPQVQPQAQL